MLVLSACSLNTTNLSSNSDLSGNGPITFAIRPINDTPSLRQQVATWNEEHPGEEVTVSVLSTDTSTAYNTVRDDLESSTPDHTVIDLDLAWVNEFARSGYLSALPESQFGVTDLVPATVNAARADGPDGNALYALPTSVEISLLYYRADLLRASKLSAPSTEEQLREACIRVGRTTPIPCRALELRQGDGLFTTAATSFVREGGDLNSMRSANAKLESTVAALNDTFRSGFTTPTSVETPFSESRQAFIDGQLLFIVDGSSLAHLVEENPSRYGVARAPVAGSGPELARGSGLAVANSATNKGTALEFATFMGADKAARERATSDHPTAPAYQTLYSDADVTARAYPAAIGRALADVGECLTIQGEYPTFTHAFEAPIAQALAATVTPAQAATEAVNRVKEVTQEA